MTVKMNLMIRTKNRAADPEIGFLTKSISKPYGRAKTMPPAWELRASYPTGEKQKIECDARESSDENFWKIGG